MTTRYQFFKNPPSTKSDKKDENILHARIVEGEVIRFPDLCDLIAKRSTFSSGEVMGIMSLFKEELIRSLKDGNRVEIDGIGSFSTVLHCPPIHDPKEIRAESIRFSRVVFKACKEFRVEMSTMRFERASEYRKQVACTAGQRRERILSYLQTHSEIQSAICMGLNGCSRYAAQLDLKFLKGQGAIERLGGPKVAVYVLPKK
ncbi:HU family DNA-binding protein [Parabacteroides bouchesdurhonensis]|uniref:HU family DNA-binding protein n=1 Tax=Parabacteroides bouchesdurhonensis TaxID=1936995 RepID=UPI000C820D16|nr:HU family DNA-binding protein [Parabacteroides bouchesdurhonensis]